MTEQEVLEALKAHSALIERAKEVASICGVTDCQRIIELEEGSSTFTAHWTEYICGQSDNCWNYIPIDYLWMTNDKIREHLKHLEDQEKKRQAELLRKREIEAAEGVVETARRHLGAAEAIARANLDAAIARLEQLKAKK